MSSGADGQHLLQDQVAALRAELATARQEADEATSTLTQRDAFWIDQVNDLRQQLTAVDQHRQVQQPAAAAEAEVQQLRQQLQRQQEEAQATQQQLSGQLERLSAACAAAEEGQAAATAQMESLQQQLSEAAAAAGGAEAQVAALQQQLGQAEQAAAAAESRLEQAQVGGPRGGGEGVGGCG
jgi:chromosome segregation ATPase